MNKSILTKQIDFLFQETAKRFWDRENLTFKDQLARGHELTDHKKTRNFQQGNERARYIEDLITQFKKTYMEAMKERYAHIRF